MLHQYLSSQSWLAALIPSPTCALSLPGGMKDREALCQVGDKTPSKSLQWLTLPIHSLKSNKLAVYQLQLLGQRASYPTKQLPKTLGQCLGLDFPVGLAPISSLVAVSAKSVECPQQR